MSNSLKKRSILCIHSYPRVLHSSNKADCFVLFFHQKWMLACEEIFWLLDVTLICFHSFISPFLLSFCFLSQETACHVHPSWPAALHIGFLMFLANRLGFASKGMIYALKWMNGKVISSLVVWFGLFTVVTTDRTALFQPDTSSFNNTHDNYYDFLAGVYLFFSFFRCNQESRLTCLQRWPV